VNRLTLCQSLMAEGGVSGTMSTTLNQTGELARVVNWIDAAWNDIQISHDDWDWMRSSNLLGAGASFATVAGQASYPLGAGAGTCGVALTVFGKWDEYSFRNYTTAVGFTDEIQMQRIIYDYWRDGYMLGAQRSVQTRPVAVAIGPDKSVCIGPPSNGLYTVTGDYWTAPTVMEADDDEPTGLPAAYHMLIVYRALLKYGFYEAAPEVLQRAKTEHARMYSIIEGKYSPQMLTAGALA
jgi:hypothetical protein